jgi:hypothetical protein
MLSIQGLSDFLIKADQICDCIPILSVVNNVVDLFIKIIVLPRMQLAAIQSSHYYTYLTEKTFTRSVLLLIPIFGQIIVYLGNRLYDDEIFALEQVRKNGLTLRHMSKRLQNNKEVVLTATLHNPAAFTSASEPLRNSESFTCEVIRARKDDLVLKYVAQRLRNSKTVLLAAIEQNGLALEWAGDVPRSSRQVVKAAVLKNRFAFMYAGSKLQNNKEFVLELIALEPRIIRLLSKELQEDLDIKEALNKAHAINLTNWDDEAFVLAKVLENPFLFKHASSRLKRNREFVLQVIMARKNGLASSQVKTWIFSHYVSREVNLAIQALENTSKLISS